jgi:hypothetical protein
MGLLLTEWIQLEYDEERGLFNITDRNGKNKIISRTYSSVTLHKILLIIIKKRGGIRLLSREFFLLESLW